MKLQQRIVDYIHVHKEHQTCKEMAIGIGVSRETMREYLKELYITPKTYSDLKDVRRLSVLNAGAGKVQSDPFLPPKMETTYHLNHKLSFENFFRKNYDDVAHLAMYYMKDKNEAGTVLSDAFLYLFTKWNQFDSEEVTKKFLIKSIKRFSLNRLKVLKRMRETVIHSVSEEFFGEDSSREEFYAEVKTELIVKIIEDLLPSQKRIVELKLQGLKEVEISMLTGIRRSNVNTCWTAALKRLRKQIAQLTKQEQLILQS